MDLYERSIEVILENQSETGAYLASPDFPTYRYSWFRDGAYIAHAMDLVGRHDSAAEFHGWVARVVNTRRETVERAVDRAAHDLPLTNEDILHTRYTAEGRDIEEQAWPNFQLDGLGTWLWSLDGHRSRTGTSLPADWVTAADLVAGYLTALWAKPCYDCWEEFPNEVHTHTLAAVYGGLAAHQKTSGVDHGSTLHDVAKLIRRVAGEHGRYVKFANSTAVDGSLLGLALPYQVVGLEDRYLLSTVAEIEATLRSGGGVRRYPTDTYYGGGEWLLLTCWLAWYYYESGSVAEADAALGWVEAQATSGGFLPEQVPVNLNDPSCYEPWRRRWGDIANPLLWSHAMYLICAVARRGRG